jgi:serine phosphatase RsbU (regulator of sigma subunit)
VRGAFLLGAFLAAVLATAFGISLRIYTQLDRAQSVQRTFSQAQAALDDLIALQLDEESELRGYLATRQRVFLDPYLLGSARYERAVDEFRVAVADLDIPGMSATIEEMLALHARWENEVARPLLADPRAKDLVRRETDGKVLVDRLRGDTNGIHALLAQRLQVAQDEVKQRIDEALLAGLTLVFAFGVVSIVFVTSRQRMLVAIDRERTIVETLQRAFQTDLDHLPGTRVGTAYVTAELDAAVGGDLYDIRRLSATRGLVVIADVSGKGIRAAVNTAFVKYTVRALARSYDDPAEILATFNAIFLETISDPNLFVVAFVGLFDAAVPAMTYASAGHSGAYLRRGASVSQLEVTGPLLGADAGFDWSSRRLELHPGDLLVLATDGLTEARDRSGALLDDAGAMELLRHTSLEPQTCADELVGAVRARSGGVVLDDLALLAIAIEGRP